MRGWTGREIFFGLVIIVILVAFGWYSGFIPRGLGINTTSSTTTTTPPGGSGDTPVPTQPPVATQPPVNNTTPQGHSIPSSSGDSPYTTPNGTAICSGDVSVKEPSGTLHSPDNDATTGEEVAITGSGYTIIFTNSASCTQYPTLTTSQVTSILNNIATSQKSSGCGGGGCTGQEQTWIFP
jgi:hypothetical protein